MLFKHDIQVYNYIRSYRLRNGLTLNQLADMLSVSTNHIWAIENHKCGCSVYIAARLCKVFKCKFDDLFELPEKSVIK